MLIPLIFGAVFPTIAFAKNQEKWAKGRILVQPKAGLSDEEFGKILQRSQCRSKRKLGKLNVHVIEVAPQAEQAMARALSRNPHVKFAEVDALVAPSEFIPNDPVYPSQWHLPIIQAPLAWDTTQGAGVTVAVLDSGIDANHPDFQGQLVSGWNVVSNNSNLSDHHGHGTAVAGIIGAVTNNATAVAGIAGAAKIMPMRITEQSDLFAYYSDIAEALTWAADQGAKVANISFGPISSSTVTNAANYFRSKGGVVLVAGGNDGTNPGLADNASLLYVSATDSNDVRPSWSNYGDYIDVAAPGQWLWTTNNGGGTGQWYGTSFSTPVAAGVVALILSRNPSLSPAEAETVLQNSADNIGNSLYYGEGRVNAAQAVAMAGNTSGGGDTESPTATITTPARDATVNGLVPVEVNAGDNVGVTNVVLYAGSVEVGEDTMAPYQFSWDSTNESDGPVTLIAYAYDAAGNEGSSGAHPVIVDNVPNPVDTTPPTVSFQNPIANSNVQGKVQVSIQAVDNVGLQSITLYIDGSLKSATNLSPLSYSWNTAPSGNGVHSLLAVAEDTSGLITNSQIQVIVGTSQALSVTVNGAGTVTSSPAGLTCSSGTCTADFASGSLVTLTAEPGSGATWSGWAGACAGSSLTCNVTLTSDQSVTGTFTTTPPPPPTGGSIQVNFQPSTATVPSGYLLDDGSAYLASRGYGWTGTWTGNTRERNTQSDPRLDTFLFVGGATVATWDYDLPNGDYLVSLASGDPSWSQGPQRVVVEGVVVINNETSAQNSYLTVIDVPVTIVDGTLTLALGGSSGTSLLNYLVLTPVNMPTHALTVTVNGTGTVTSSPAGLTCSSGTCTADFASGSLVTLTAEPGSGATWSGWAGACAGSSLTCNVTLTSDQSVTGTFTTTPPPPPTTQALSVTVNGAGTVTSSPAGLTCSSGTCTADFASGSLVTLTAEPGSGATWSGWAGACAGSSLTCNVTLTSDQSVTGTFTTTPPPPPTGGSIQVNFQPSTATVPSGYLLDDGSAYLASRGYGWTGTWTGNTRERNTQSDPRLDTFLFVGGATVATWDYDLPNGDYLVSLASGDPSWSQGPQRVVVEGVVVINNETSAQNSYLTVIDVPVTIVDGTLTLALGGSSGTSLLNYLVLTPVNMPTHALTVTVNGTGTVTSSPAGLTCSSGTCTADFASGSLVTLTAEPGSGATWSGWAGACAGSSLTCNVTLTSDQSVTGTFTTTPPPPPTGGSIQVNFQPSTATVPSGYLLDDGSAYLASRGYGWTGTWTGNTRERNTQSDPRLDTFLFVGGATVATWDYDLPNGDYLVSLASGDPSWSQGPQRVVVEGVVVINNETSAQNSYLTVIDVPVTIVDGTLTLALGGSSGTSLLNYIQINPVP